MQADKEEANEKSASLERLEDRERPPGPPD